MPGEDIPRMYGVTCPNSTPDSFHTVRLGKATLPADATTAKLHKQVVENNELTGFSLCPVCNVDIPVVLDHVRFVDDSEAPPEHAANHF
jgi:hypothetical protein